MNLFFRFSLMVMLCLFSVRSAMAQEAALKFADYEAITYDWYDAQNTKHNSKLTDVATDPYQIVALLRTAYCDPRVPGPLYNGYAQNGTDRENPVYYGAVAGGWEIAADDVQAPTQEGYTVFLVSVKNTATPISTSLASSSSFANKNELVNYIKGQIESVTLLTDGMRVGDGANKGTVFNFSGTLNKFFFLSKGQSRKNQTPFQKVPFLNMFEQFSPTDGTEGSETGDFYQKMSNGESYPIQHDCSSVLENRHYFAMSGNSGTTAYAMDGLNFFIPDYRMMYNGTKEYTDNSGWWPVTRTQDKRDQNAPTSNLYSKYAVYDEGHLPQTMIYNINLSATAQIVDDTYCDVTLAWHSSVDEISSNAIPQIYYVYREVTDQFGNTSFVLLDQIRNIIDEYPIHNVDDNFYYLGEKQNKFTYRVERYPDSYTIKYKVQGRPEPDHRFKLTYSNEAEVAIPGQDPLEALDLKINGNYVSVYDVNGEVNKYDNYITVSNGLVYKLKVSHLYGDNSDSGIRTTQFKLYRQEGKSSEKMLVGTLNINKEYIGYINNGGNFVYYYQLKYDFVYEDETQRSDAQHTGMSGTLKGPQAVQSSTTSYNAFIASDEVDFNNIRFCDMFEVSTATNDYPDNYSYSLEVNTGAVVANEESNAHSNVITVPVYKTDIDLSGNQYTKEQVDGDIARGLNAEEGKVAIDVEAHPEQVIYRYDVMRGLNGNTPNTYVAYAQHTEDGSYQPMNALFDSQGDKVGNGNEVVDVRTYDETMTTSAIAKYVPVVEVYRPDGTMENKNTYGAPMKDVAFGNVDVELVDKGMSNYSWEDEYGTYAYYNVVVRAKANVPEGYSLYKYRAWRLCDDVKEKLEEYKYRESTDFLFDQIDDVDPNTEWTVLGDEVVATNVMKGTFGAKVPSSGALNVDIIVRLYYKKNTTTNASHHLMAEGGDYYIAQKTFNVKINNTPTGIIGVAYSSNPVNVVYYNMLGVASDTPYPGVNIIVTTYEDGSKTTVKKIVK